jgi:hypothetical protein
MKQEHILNGKKDTLTRIEDLQQRKPYIEHLLHTAWNLCSTALWNDSEFSDKEKDEARNIIKQYLAQATDPYKAYLAFCERVLLARQYIHRYARSSSYLPLPTEWLDQNNMSGFTGTKKWYERLLSVRASLPVYKIENKALAEAVLEMSEEPSADNFVYWRRYFIEKGASGLLQLFLATVCNGQFDKVKW